MILIAKVPRIVVNGLLLEEPLLDIDTANEHEGGVLLER
jgi:hypothetical protein